MIGITLAQDPLSWLIDNFAFFTITYIGFWVITLCLWMLNEFVNSGIKHMLNLDHKDAPEVTIPNFVGKFMSMLVPKVKVPAYGLHDGSPYYVNSEGDREYRSMGNLDDVKILAEEIHGDKKVATIKDPDPLFKIVIYIFIFDIAFGLASFFFKPVAICVAIAGIYFAIRFTLGMVYSNTGRIKKVETRVHALEDKC